MFFIIQEEIKKYTNPVPTKDSRVGQADRERSQKRRGGLGVTGSKETQQMGDWKSVKRERSTRKTGAWSLTGYGG